MQALNADLSAPTAELSRRNSEDNGESIPLSKKAVVLLKKELAQKTEALNKALKRENELKVSRLHLIHNQGSGCLVCLGLFFFSLGLQISLTELQSLLRELEGRNEGQAANIESLTATLTTKDEIITVGNPIFAPYIQISFLCSAAPEFLFWPLSRFSTSALVREETVELITPKIRSLTPAWRRRFLGFPREREP